MPKFFRNYIFPPLIGSLTNFCILVLIPAAFISLSYLLKGGHLPPTLNFNTLLVGQQLQEMLKLSRYVAFVFLIIPGLVVSFLLLNRSWRQILLHSLLITVFDMVLIILLAFFALIVLDPTGQKGLAEASFLLIFATVFWFIPTCLANLYGLTLGKFVQEKKYQWTTVLIIIPMIYIILKRSGAN